MSQVGIHEAKTQLSKLLAKVITGEEVIIAKGGIPIAKIVPISSSLKKRSPGQDVGEDFFIDDDFDAPLPKSLLAQFEK